MTAPARLDRSLIRVSGPDAVSFLDNLLTQDIGEGGLQYAALLTPQGKVNTDMFLWRDADGVIIDCANSRGDDLLRRLAMYKLRANVTIADVSDRFAVAVSATQFEGAARDPRLPALGWRKLVSANSAPAPSGDAFEQRRIALGVPDLARDAAPDEVFAGEALLEELNGVDFQKGCFVGQENVSRMKRRATTRRKFCPIVFEGDCPPFGTKVMADSVDLGTVRTGVGGRALALLRLDRADEALAAGQAFHVDARQTRLDPPRWLIMPPAADAPG